MNATLTQKIGDYELVVKPMVGPAAGVYSACLLSADRRHNHTFSNSNPLFGVVPRTPKDAVMALASQIASHVVGADDKSSKWRQSLATTLREYADGLA